MSIIAALHGGDASLCIITLDKTHTEKYAKWRKTLGGYAMGGHIITPHGIILDSSNFSGTLKFDG